MASIDSLIRPIADDRDDLKLAVLMAHTFSQIPRGNYGDFSLRRNWHKFPLRKMYVLSESHYMAGDCTESGEYFESICRYFGFENIGQINIGNDAYGHRYVLVEGNVNGKNITIIFDPDKNEMLLNNTGVGADYFNAYRMLLKKDCKHELTQMPFTFGGKPIFTKKSDWGSLAIEYYNSYNSKQFSPYYSCCNKIPMIVFDEEDQACWMEWEGAYGGEALLNIIVQENYPRKREFLFALGYETSNLHFQLLLNWITHFES